MFCLISNGLILFQEIEDARQSMLRKVYFLTNEVLHLLCEGLSRLSRNLPHVVFAQNGSTFFPRTSLFFILLSTGQTLQVAFTQLKPRPLFFCFFCFSSSSLLLCIWFSCSTKKLVAIWISLKYICIFTNMSFYFVLFF